ncbi:MAG TPA: hypothetical protein VL443_28480 [Cyclobacteriaceae bacterium]|jgi:hypothetical protein|nr:hypothetical protein [Cyclobacteriaceae bacterium]
MKKKAIIQSVLFLVILILLLTIVIRTLDFGVRNSSYAQYAKVNYIGNHRADTQLAFFGSSVGEVSLNANLIEEQTGKSAYNYCIDGTRFMQYDGLIKEFNAYSINCEMVVFAETFFSLSKVDQLTEVDRFLPYINNETIYTSLYFIQPELMWKLRYIPFYKFIVAKQGYYKAAALGLKEMIGGKSLLRDDTLKGFTPKKLHWQVGLDELNKASKPIEIQLDTIALQHYSSTIEEIRKKGRKVLIVIPPIHEDGLRLLPDLEKLRKTLASMERDGVYFRDYSMSDLSREKNYFYNNSHVNELGARKFSKHLALTIDSILMTAKK